MRRAHGRAGRERGNGQDGRRLLTALAAAALLTACADGGGSAPGGGPERGTTSSSANPDAPPQWTGEGTADARVSFADGPALEAATGVDFVNGLAEVWDWELVEETGTPDGAEGSITLTNTGNGCRVLDERAPYEGASTDDGAASMALAQDGLAGAEIVAGPSQDLMGLGEGMGEDGPNYNVARALGRDGDGQWVLVTARAFVALGEQQVITVRCPSGDGIDLTRSQLAGVAYANLQGLDRLP